MWRFKAGYDACMTVTISNRETDEAKCCLKVFNNSDSFSFPLSPSKMTNDTQSQDVAEALLRSV